MKKLVRILTLGLATVMTCGMIASAEETPILLSLEAEGGGVCTVAQDGSSARLAGKKADNSGDEYLNTWHMLGEDVEDFVWEFTYTPAAASWNMDKIMFRCENTGENEWNGYALQIKGTEFAESAQRGLSICKGEAWGAPYAYLNYTLEAGVTYKVKIAMTGQKIDVWFYKASESAPASPTLTATVPNVTSTDPEVEVPYKDIFIPAGDFQFVSWGGDFTLANMTLTIPEEPTTTTTTTTTTSSTTTTKSTSSTAAAATSSTQASSPATGDATPVFAIAGLFALSLAGVLTVKKRNA